MISKLGITRNLVLLLILLCTGVSLFSFWNVNGQSLTTVTQTMVTTGEAPSTVTSYQTSNIVSTISNEPLYFGSDICSFQGTYPSMGCIHGDVSSFPNGTTHLSFLEPLTGFSCGVVWLNQWFDRGAMVEASITDFWGTFPLVLTIYSSNNFNNWIAANKCNPYQTSVPYASSPIDITAIEKTYDLSWVAPQSGTYYFVFVSSDLASADVNGYIQGVQRVTTYQTTTAFTETSIGTYSSTLMMLQTNTLSAPAASTNPFLIAIEIGIIGIIIAAAVWAFIYGGKKHPKNETAERPSENSTSNIVATHEVKRSETEPTRAKPKANLGKQFCLECGSELPLGSKFCNKCGTKQTG